MAHPAVIAANWPSKPLQTSVTFQWPENQLAEESV
jgi:hypothetical protein